MVSGSSSRDLVGHHKWPFRGLSDLHLGESNCHLEAGGESLISLIYWELLLSSFQSLLTTISTIWRSHRSQDYTWQSQRPCGLCKQNAMFIIVYSTKNTMHQNAMVANGSGNSFCFSFGLRIGSMTAVRIGSAPFVSPAKSNQRSKPKGNAALEQLLCSYLCRICYMCYDTNFDILRVCAEK